MTTRSINALTESVVGLYKNDCVKIDGPFKTVDKLELATLDWMHWFNEHRLHSSIGYKTPNEIEQRYREISAATATERTRPPLKPGRFSAGRLELRVRVGGGETSGQRRILHQTSRTMPSPKKLASVQSRTS